MRAAALLTVYSLLIIAMGTLSYMARSPGSNALTAIIVPLIAGGLCISCAIALLMHRRNRGLARIAVIAAYALPALVAVGSGMRISGALAGHRAYVAQQELVAKDPATVQPIVEARQMYDTGYQAVGIASITALSLLVLTAIVIVRPSLPPEANTAVPVVPLEPVGSLSAAAMRPDSGGGAGQGGSSATGSGTGGDSPIGLG